MDSGHFVFKFLFLSLISQALSYSVIEIKPGNLISGNRKHLRDDSLYCESWRFSVETNDAGYWTNVPERCVSFVKDYMTGDRYLSDSNAVADASFTFAKAVEIAGDGKDAWFFDVDETLLSNLPYYAANGYGSEDFNELSWDEWVDLAQAPALPASLRLYKELQQLGFTIFILTGRSEYQRNVTEKNLLYSGYSNWERLILRAEADESKPAIIYKSEQRGVVEAEGYRIHGNSGDQWSDLLGVTVALRSFKLPNPMYYIS